MREVRILYHHVRDMAPLDMSTNFPRYFFEIDGGKKIRPAMVLAMSYALNCHSLGQSGEINSSYANPSQKRLAEITEMIHTASLFHDDVIDKVATNLIIFFLIIQMG